MLATHKITATLLAVLSIICVCQCQQVPSSVQSAGAKIALSQISSGTERFSLQVFRSLAQQVPDDHDFIMSPFSMWSLLMLTAEGAAGNTYAELQRVLGLPDDLSYIRESYSLIQRNFKVNTSTIELAVTQVLFTDRNRPVERDLEDSLQRVYDADHVTVDFRDAVEAFYTINDYVMDKTHGRLGNVVTLDDLKEAQLMLISAIYFKGQWKTPFNRSDTKLETFYDESGRPLGEVNMMYQNGLFAYTSVAALNAHVLELQYGVQDRLSMVFILPKKGDTVMNVISRLVDVGMTKVMNELAAAKINFEDEEVELFLPRFTTRADFVLNQIFQDMGLKDIFDPLAANLNKISKQAFLSRIIHKAQIELNEEGTVVAAATVGDFINKSSPPRFYANRPFAYVLIDKRTNIVLFCGQIKDPIKNSKA